MNRKIFVGNVPFHCTREEFQEIFKHLEGFETADIIRRYKSKLSRGFGFVVFKDDKNAKKLLDIGEMPFKDRILRFSPYESDDKPTKTEKPTKHTNQMITLTKPIHRLYVSNLDDDISYHELKSCISKSGINISTCFVNTKKDKTTGIVFLDTLEDYTKLLENPPIVNGKPLIVKPYKKINNDTKCTNVQTIYREGFRAGHIVGFQQGFQQGVSHKNTETRQ